MGDEKDFKIKTNIWNENLEKEVKNIGLNCEKYRWISNHISERISFKYNYLMYLAIIIGPIAGVLSTFSEKTPDINILVTLFSFFNGILSAVIKFSNFDEKSLKFKNMAVKYSSLSGNINRQLALQPKDRINSGTYLDWISTYYDQLFSETPLIEEKYIELWREYSKRENVERPDSPKTENREIKINIEPSTFSDTKMKYELERLNRG